MNINNEDVLTGFIMKARTGDELALKWLYNTFAKNMFNICVRMAGNKDDAEDLLQNSFIIAFNNLGQLKEPYKFGGWLKRIVVNECIHFCKKKLEKSEPIDDDLPIGAEDEDEWWVDINFEHIYESIKALPEKCRIVFSLYVLEDFSHKQIAQNLGISEGTSKSQYFRAKALLRESLDKQLQYNG